MDPRRLFGVVDMGSNGIRFSITDLSTGSARILPTVYQDRADISLYDAQFEFGNPERMPISTTVQERVISRLLRYKLICDDFDVPPENIRILATEATRTAPNSTEFRAAIKAATGWEIQMLSKEEEGRIGALGVASSLADVEGLVMDLGGGSVQFSYLMFVNGTVHIHPEGAVSFPYGAAELTRRLTEARARGNDAVEALKNEMKTCFRDALLKLKMPPELEKKMKRDEVTNLYLSGGGFRGWGYSILAVERIHPYPISILNGYSVNRSKFQDFRTVMNSLSTPGVKIYGVSQRRALQIPAVAFLVEALMTCIPSITTTYFCQGGVREGILFNDLPIKIRSQHPLLVATAPFRLHETDKILSLLHDSLPHVRDPLAPPPGFRTVFLEAVANFMYAHASIPRESRTSAALHSTTTGIAAYAHGLSHIDRAMLALTMCDRWFGKLSPPDKNFLNCLRLIPSSTQAWWCQYIGGVAALISHMYPAGIKGEQNRLRFSARTIELPTPDKATTEYHLAFTVTIPNENDPSFDLDCVSEIIRRIKKTGTKGQLIRLAERRSVLDQEQEVEHLKVMMKLNIGEKSSNNSSLHEFSHHSID
ncbi:hypothetical protein FQN57_006190 [Myotisia sp. PD_48]|nr:hypothetical protein FQN57_006190 [Myotisia sp. PD_48]